MVVPRRTLRPAERLLGCDPDALLDYALEASWAEEPDALPAEVRAEYARTLRDPETIHAICEEYRAATLDGEHDEADRGCPKISCSVLDLWAHDGAVADWYDPLELW